MELKIDPNVRSSNTISQLPLSGKTFEHLAYVFKVSEAKDNSTEITLSDVLKTKIAGLSKAMEENQSIANIMNTAQSTLSQVADTLNSIRNSQSGGDILGAALDDISDAKEGISSFVANVIAPAINKHSVAIENLK